MNSSFISKIFYFWSSFTGTDCRHPNHKGWLSVLPEDSKSSQGQLDCGLGAGPVGDDWLPIGDRVVTRWHRWPIARPSGGYREPRGSGGNVDPIHWIPPELGSSFEIHSEEGFAGIEERIRRKMRGQQLLSASLSNLNTGTAVDGYQQEL